MSTPRCARCENPIMVGTGLMTVDYGEVQEIYEGGELDVANGDTIYLCEVCAGPFSKLLKEIFE